MWSWLKALFGYAPHIDPPVFGPYASRLEAYTNAMAHAGLFQGQSLELTTGTPSMVPLIPAKPTFLVLRPILFVDAKLGSVVSYRSPLMPGSSVTHRLVSGSVAKGFIPSGDNNRYSEPTNPVTAENFLGEIVGIFPFTE